MLSDSKGKLINLIRDMLHDLGYDEDGARLVTNYSLPFYVCYQDSNADAHVCLIHGDMFLMPVIVRESSEGEYADNVGPQTLATSIAVYQQNNIARERAGLPKLNIMEIPCISFVDTTPVFYASPVSTQLERGVATGTRPRDPTYFKSYSMDAFGLNRDPDQPSDHMENVIVCLSRFKDRAKQLWSRYNFL